MGNYELNSKYDFDVIFDSLRKPEHHFFLHQTKTRFITKALEISLSFRLFC